MGIGRGTLKLLMQEGLRRPYKGKVLTLGRQLISLRESELESIAKEIQYPLHTCNRLDPLSRIPEEREQGFISDVYLFTRLGFSECKSIDYSDYEGCDFVFDLNQPDLPENLLFQFDVVVDGGTIEHVFHLPNVFKNLHHLIPIGGRILHFSPSSNHVDHGFYMFSPTLFWDYYQANSYEINQMQIIRYNPWHDILWKIWKYEPGCLNSVSYGGLDSGMFAIHCVITKSPNSTFNVIPQQRNYREGLWKGKEQKRTANAWLLKGKRWVKQNRFLYPLLKPFARLFRPRKGIKLNPVAKL